MSATLDLRTTILSAWQTNNQVTIRLVEDVIVGSSGTNRCAGNGQIGGEAILEQHHACVDVAAEFVEQGR